MFSTVATDLPLTEPMITSAQIIGGRSLGGAELFYARLVSALHRAGVPCEAHLFEKGCHGTSLSTAEVNHPSAHRSRWLTLAREWLDDTFDFHLGTGETGG